MITPPLHHVSNMQFVSKNRPAVRALALVLGTLVLGACADTTHPVASAPTEAAAATPSATDGQRLARAFAGAMANPEIRALVRDAMRDSRFNEHKLVLQEFAATPAGQRLVEAAARSAGVDAPVVQGWINGLPAMDFYVPVSAQRGSWRGAGDLVVGLNTSADETTLTGYAPDGRVHHLQAGKTPAQTVLLMAPAEPKVQTGRIVASGDLIEPGAPDAQVVTTLNVPGPRMAIGATYTGASIYRFRNYLPDGWGGIELMVKTYNVKGGTRLDEEIMSEGGGCLGFIPGCYDAWSYPQRQIVMGTWIKVWERDSGINEQGGDDFWGEMAFGGYGNANVHTFWIGCTAAGANSSPYCDTIDPNWIFMQTPSVDIVFNHSTNGVYDIY